MKLHNLFITSFLLLISFHTLANDAPAAAAKVIKAQGVVTAINAENQSRALERGSDIFEQDTVMTAAAGFATLRFTDGTLIDLSEGSKFLIKAYNYNEADAKKDKFSTEVIEGGFRAITGGIATRNPQAVTAKARLTTLTVRGTFFTLICPQCENCHDVIQFTLKGLTAITYQGKEYLIGQGAQANSFSLKNGNVTLSSKIPSTLPVIFSGSPAELEKLISMESPAKKSEAATQKGGGGGGGGCADSPCGTLDCVQNSLPATSTH